MHTHAPLSFSDVLKDALFNIGFRAIRHHMRLARKLEGTPQFAMAGRLHIREALAIQTTIKSQRLGPYRHLPESGHGEFLEAA